MKTTKTLGVIYIVAVCSAIVGTLWAEDNCTTLPPDASTKQVEIEKIKLLAKHTQDRIEIQGSTRLENDNFEESIQRRAYGYSEHGQVVVTRSKDQIRVCLR